MKAYNRLKQLSDFSVILLLFFLLFFPFEKSFCTDAIEGKTSNAKPRTSSQKSPKQKIEEQKDFGQKTSDKKNSRAKVSALYQSSLKLEQNPALVYQGTPQRGDADISARKNLYWNPKDSGIDEQKTDSTSLLKKLAIDDKSLKLLVSSLPEFKIFTLESPSRLVIDLKNSQFADNFEQKKLPDFVENFRFNRNQKDLRIVFELNSKLNIGKSVFSQKENMILCDLQKQESDNKIDSSSSNDNQKQSQIYRNSLDSSVIFFSPNSRRPRVAGSPDIPKQDFVRVSRSFGISAQPESELKNLITKIDKSGRKIEIDTESGIISEISKDSMRQYKLRDNQQPNSKKISAAENSVEMAAGARNSKRILKKPVIVIDAGHGGKDPGTIGIFARSKEKNLTLAYAKELAKNLQKTRNYEVFLTRDSDKFIPLKERVQKARRKKADLFISLHANAINETSVSGFSIYTLSEKSSDKQAEILAQKENQADIINGINLSESSREVMKTLIDLAQRDSKNSSAKFAQNVIEEMKGENIEILQNSHRFAGFMVLTAPDIASVLIELGYLSNKKEEKLINSLGYRRLIAKSISRAVENFFSETN